MNGADWRQYFFYGNFEKKIQNTKKFNPYFFISDQYIATQIGNTRLGPNEPMFQ